MGDEATLTAWTLEFLLRGDGRQPSTCIRRLETRENLGVASGQS